MVLYVDIFCLCSVLQKQPLSYCFWRLFSPWREVSWRQHMLIVFFSHMEKEEVWVKGITGRIVRETSHEGAHSLTFCSWRLCTLNLNRTTSQHITMNMLCCVFRRFEHKYAAGTQLHFVLTSIKPFCHPLTSPKKSFFTSLCRRQNVQNRPDSEMGNTQESFLSLLHNMCDFVWMLALVKRTEAACLKAIKNRIMEKIPKKNTTHDYKSY